MVIRELVDEVVLANDVGPMALVLLDVVLLQVVRMIQRPLLTCVSRVMMEVIHGSPLLASVSGMISRVLMVILTGHVG